jgi:MoxR-like ATPase
MTQTIDTITKVNVRQLKALLASAPVETAIMIWGAPGVGKSAAVAQAAKELNADLLIERLNTKAPEDLEGVPFPKEEEGRLYTYFAPPHRFRNVTREDARPTLFFMDELNTAQPHVQVVAMQIVLDRRAGAFEFGSNVRMVAAGNRAGDRAAVHTMPAPLMNRFEHYELVAQIDEWTQWALASEIDPTIIGYLRSQPAKLSTFDPDSTSPAFATPRSYEMLDRRIKLMTWEHELLPSAMAATVGAGVALELAAFRRLKHDLPDTEAILHDGAHAPVPQQADRCYFVMSALAAALLKQPTYKRVTESLLYVTRMPAELGAKFVRDILLANSEARNYVKPAFSNEPKLARQFTDKWRETIRLLQGESSSGGLETTDAALRAA